MQAKAEPLREGVVVIKEDTTMEQLQELGRRFHERFGVTPVQIAIHRDEGHWKGEEWKPNLHAHIVFDWYDHATGKSIKTSKLDAAEMQSITAETLEMERGTSSERRHLDSARYKAQERFRELQALHAEAEELQKEVSGLTTAKAAKEESIAIIREIGSKVRGRISGKDKREKKKLTDKLEKTIKAAKDNDAVASEERNKRIDLEKALESTSVQLEAARSEINTLRQSGATARKEAQGLQKEIDSIKQNLPEVLPQAAAMGLSVDAAITLASGKEVHLRSIRDPNGNVLSMEGGEPIRLRWNKRIEAYLALTWHAVKDWVKEAIRSPWCAVNGISNDIRRKGIRL